MDAVQTLDELAPMAAREYGSQTFIECWSSHSPGSQLSFEEFDVRVAHARAYLIRHGVQASDRVALLAHASPDTLALSLAVPSIGAVLVQLNWRQPNGILATMICGLDCHVIVVGRGFVEHGRNLHQRCSTKSLLIADAATRYEGGTPVSGEVDIDCATTAESDPGASRRELPSNTCPGATHAPIAADDVAVVMFTSGTSSLPKPVPLTHRGLLWACRSKAHAEEEALGLPLSRAPQDGAQHHRGTLAFLPTFHVIGFTNNFLYNLLSGVRCMVHLDAASVKLSSSILLKAARELRPSILDTVPALLDAMISISAGELHVNSEDAATLRSCKAVLYGGAHMSFSTASCLRSNGIAIHSQYGQTELAGMVLIGAPGAPHGGMRPVRGIQARLIDANVSQGSSSPAPAVVHPGKSPATDGAMPHKSGELILSNVGSLMPGYWPLLDADSRQGCEQNRCTKPEDTAKQDDVHATRDWATGDIFDEINGDAGSGGWLVHVCRRDELLLHSSGEMTNPVAVEAALLPCLRSILEVRDCCVFGAGRSHAALVMELWPHAEELPLQTLSVDPEARLAASTCDAMPLLQIDATAEIAGTTLCSSLLSAISLASAQVPQYSLPPSRLVLIVHPQKHLPLARTAKGGIIREQIEQRFGTFLDFALHATGPSGESAASCGDAAGDASGSSRDAGDSLGLVALTGNSQVYEITKLSDAEAAMDALVQHLKVFLLFAVLLRHLQRFTVRTCHAWARVKAGHAGICVANNIMQIGAVEGLAFVSGLALAGRVISFKEVVTPFVLIMVFRLIVHPLLEWMCAYQADIGTAHLWFILMLGVGRAWCWLLSQLPRQVARIRVAVVLGVLLWRLIRAPTHIGFHGEPFARRILFYLFFGDRNYLQIIHNLPLFLLGYVWLDAGVAAAHYTKPWRLSARATALVRTIAPYTSRLKSCQRHRWLGGVLMLIASFVIDPLLFGCFVKKYKALEEEPITAYARAALRVGSLAMTLPRYDTALTEAGRSQLLAYLLHDAVFSIGSTFVRKLCMHSSLSIGKTISAISNGLLGSGSLGIAILTIVGTGLYCAVCLSVQLALSHPRPLLRYCCITQSLTSRIRITGTSCFHRCRHMLTRCCNDVQYKRVSTDADAV